LVGDHWLKSKQSKANNACRFIHNFMRRDIYGHGNNAFDSSRMVFVDFFNAKGLTKSPTRL
jgi:hypothetical protein